MAITAAENSWQTLQDALTLDWQKIDPAIESSVDEFDPNALACSLPEVIDRFPTVNLSIERDIGQLEGQEEHIIEETLNVFSDHACKH